MGETNMPHCLCPHPVKCGGFSTGEQNRLSPPKLVVVSHGVAFCTWWGHWQLGLAPRSLFLNWLHCIMQYAIKLHHRYFLFAYPRAAADWRGGSRVAAACPGLHGCFVPSKPSHHGANRAAFCFLRHAATFQKAFQHGLCFLRNELMWSLEASDTAYLGTHGGKIPADQKDAKILSNHLREGCVFYKSDLMRSL